MDKPRLIDANKLKKELLHAIWLPEWEHIRDKILEDIDLQPTAYNIDKVVEQLEELRTYEKDGQCPKHDKCSKEPYECTSCYTTTAIEIVKGGGIDE